jgi:hypothetical protein
MNLFEWGDISTGVYVALIIAGICMYVVIFHLEYVIGDKNAKIVHDYSEKCLIPCSEKKLCDKLSNLRDNGYYLFNDNPEKCIVSKWEISHFITHIFLGYFTNIYISQSISVGFEIYEHYVLDCGSYLDLGYNFMGFLVGHFLKNYIK